MAHLTGKRLQAQPVVTAEISNNLPAPTTSFIGRARELEEVQRLFTATRLLTLSGVGGVGKTRLALEFASKLIPEVPDGVCFVDLAPLSAPRLVITTLAHALGLRDAGSRPLAERLKKYLRARTMLLVFDNCEHLTEACARLVGELLRACPDIRVLVTSRQPFRLTEEVTWRVPSLSLPDAEKRNSAETVMSSESGHLFIERALAVRPDFTVTDVNAGAIADICHRLDGIPLALELAAARIRMLGVDQIAARLSDRFRLLTAGSVAALPRHQTLRGMIDWSYEWLPGPEQALFRRLSVFAGGFDLEAVEAICTGGEIGKSDVFDLVAQLVDKSLVVSEDHAGTVRYRLLETVRQYGAERLTEAGEEVAFRRHHRDFYLELAERADREQHGPDLAMWLTRLEEQLGNLRAALEWCAIGSEGLEKGLRIADALFRFWDTRGRLREGRDWLANFLSRPNAATPGVRARALGAASYLAFWLGDRDAAVTFGEESLRLAHVEGNRLILGRAARQYSFVLLWMGHLDRARALLEESLDAARDLGDEVLESVTLANLGEIAIQRGEHDRAAKFLEEALELARRRRDPWSTALALGTRGRLAWRCQDFDRAAESLREAMALRWTLQDRRNISVQLEWLGWIASATGASKRAVYLLAAAEAARESLGITLLPGFRESHDRALSDARAGLREKSFRSAWLAGLALPFSVTVEYARSPDVYLPPPKLPARPRGRHAGEPHTSLLTAREQEVAALIARGLTNQQIARNLVVTQRTAETHIEHILAKLGFRSRAQVAAWVVERGLVAGSPG